MAAFEYCCNLVTFASQSSHERRKITASRLKCILEQLLPSFESMSIKAFPSVSRTVDRERTDPELNSLQVL